MKKATTFRIHEELLEALKALAKAEYMNTTQYVEHLIKEAVKASKQ